MSGTPLVSIVTPTLNQAQFLAHALASVRTQTYPGVEHIVIDGGSTDGTIDILRREGDAGAIRWVTEPDAGMYDAVNKGLAMATGDILAYLNSDDAYLPWTVEVVVRAFREHRDADLLFGDGIKVDETNGKHRLRLFAPFDRVSLANYESLMQPAVFWRRRLFERLGGFDAGQRYVADLDYWLRASSAGVRIAHVNEILAVERIHAGRLSSAQGEAMAVENRVMRARHGADAGPEGRLRAMAREAIWQRWLWLRFLTAFALRPIPSSWSHFLRDGGVKVKPNRIDEGTRVTNLKPLWHAVTSQLAVDVLGGGGQQRQSRPRRRRRRPAFGLLRFVLPKLVDARYRLATGRAPEPAPARPQAAK